MATRETMGKDIEPGLIARVSAGLRYMVTGKQPIWFGPLDPMPVVVPADQQPSVAGRQFDFPVGYNQRTTPRGDEQISFAQMRALADSYDLLRIVIETRKDQVCKLKWTIKPREKKAKPDDRCKLIRDFFQSPDKEHTWDDWLRMLLEDLFVIDAPTIYPRMTKGGALYSLEPVDGATIKRVLDERGRTPMAPDTAYQQVLKGLSAVNYTRDELIYSPRNVRTHKIYGYSPVEQIIMTVNIALRRQVNQLSYYTEGNVPNTIFRVPKEWNPDQIKQFQLWWDSITSGQSKHVGRFIPEGPDPIDTKAQALKDEYDEWLARIVCYAFSVEATQFVKQNNRAVAETVREQAMSEGLAPVQNWIRNLCNFIVTKHFDAPDLEFWWDDEEAIDAKTRAEVNKIYVDAKVIHPDEVREDLGLDPLTPEQKSDLNPPPPPAFGMPGAQPAEEDLKEIPDTKAKPATAKEAVAKAAGKSFPVPAKKKRVAKAIAAMTDVLTEFLEEQGEQISVKLSSVIEFTSVDIEGEAKRTPKTDAILGLIDFDDWAATLPEKLEPFIVAVATGGGGDALKAIGVVSDDEVEALLREGTQTWAKNRAAEMVGMKRVDGELVPNPNAKWQITEGTREWLRGITDQAITEGWSADTFAKAVQENYAFSPDRADMISRTELARADIAGTVEGWKASGVVSAVKFLANPDCCDVCNEMDGQLFPVDSGEEILPHPRCECNVLAVLDDETED